MSWNKKTNGELVKLADLGGGGGDANIWYGSHAEYAEEKAQIADETTLLFNDDIGLEAESDYYSEVEQVIGTYLGKPLYRKVYVFSSLVNISFSQWQALENIIIDTDVIIRCFCTSSTGTYYDLMATKTTGNVIAVQTARNGNGAEARTITFEYTKTTDSVVGVVGGIKKGDNYSTNEQVIGTWLGKPLYRKVIDYGYGSSTTGSYVYKAHGISNIDTITKVSGTIKFASGQVSALPFVSTSALNPQVSIVADADNVGYMSGNARTTEYFVFTLEYTKTTD